MRVEGVDSVRGEMTELGLSADGCGRDGSAGAVVKTNF